MKKQLGTGKWAGASILSAIAASLCCITPLLALISGATGAASTFSWMEPLRPYLIAITILVLAFAWYQLLKPKSKEDIDCNCEEDGKTPFLQTQLFLGLVTVFSFLMLTFPYYSNIFYPTNNKTVIIENKADVLTKEFKIEGMTCTGCEEHVNLKVNELEGIVNVNTSYEKGNTVIEYDKTKTNEIELEKAINSTGYKAIIQNKD